MAENEKLAEDGGSKHRANPVFFISLVGVSPIGFVDIHEYIFDIYTKAYDFHGSNVKVVSAQDLLTFYKSKNKRANRYHVRVYQLVEYFVQHHSDGHFVLDECPFLSVGKLILGFIKRDAVTYFKDYIINPIKFKFSSILKFRWRT